MPEDVDPVAGGSPSDYDYAAADPVNNLDLDGRLCYDNNWRPSRVTMYLCPSDTKKLRRKFERAIKNHEALVHVFCGFMGGAISYLAGVGCEIAYWWFKGQIRKNLKKAVKAKKCFTVTIILPPVPPQVFASHTGASKNQPYCRMDE